MGLDPSQYQGKNVEILLSARESYNGNMMKVFNKENKKSIHTVYYKRQKDSIYI